MKQMVLLGCLLTLGLFGLASCATDNEDEPFPTHSNVNADVPVAGAATPAPGESSAGWKW